MADKLAEIADAVGTVVWPAVTPQFGGGSSVALNCNSAPYEYSNSDAAPFPQYYDGSHLDVSCTFISEWDIPPQADADRFIVRDLAIHTLGMIPVMDSYTDLLGQSCATSFAQVAKSAPGWVLSSPPPADQTNINEIFGVSLSTTPETSPTYPFFPPSTVPIVDAQGAYNGPAIASSALAIDAQIMRGGGRLLHDLIRRDVYSDLASAAQQSAQALDPNSGNQLAWGLSPSLASPTTEPYGSLSHAARVLMGRWEIGDPSDFPTTYQPQCEGTAAISLVPAAFGSDLPARVSDLPIRTPGEATASQLVDSTGIVIGSCVIQNQTSALRGALLDQLVTQEDLRNGLPLNVNGPLRTVFSNTLSAVNDAEIAFAFQRTLSTYLLLTNTYDTSSLVSDGGVACQVWLPPLTLDPGTNTNIDLPAGLQAVLAPSAAASIANLDGVVVAGGLDRSRLATDPIARSGGMLEASQCGEALGLSAGSGWSPWGIPTATSVPTATATDGAGNLQIYTLPAADFQDAFSMGQAFERRLVLLEALANDKRITGSSNILSGTSTNPEAVARGGIAELRSWAGSTIVHAWPTPTVIASNFQPSAFVVDVAGMSNADLGLATGTSITPSTTSLLNMFGFVYGPPWVAECAAGVRTDCPAGFSTTYVQTASSVAPVTGTGIGPGTVDNEFQLTVGFSSSTATNFQPPISISSGSDTDGTTSPAHLYMVRLHDPTSPAGHGRVMGVIRFAAVVAPTYPFLLRAPQFISADSDTFDTFSFVDSPMQRELIHDAIDLGRWVGATPPALGDQSAAQNSGYCVDGVPRDIFVPLDNELVNGGTSFEDSWQQYLSLAQQAAQTSDALGQQLIADDLQISENEQTAAEQLANLCGDFGTLSTVTVATDGTTSAGSSDPTTSTCLSEPMTDIVFLGALPAALTTDPSQVTTYLKGPTVLNCAGTAGTSSASPLCQKSSLTAGALNVVTGAPIPQPSLPTSSVFTSPCSSLTGSSGIQASLATSFQSTSFLGVLQNGAFGSDAINAIVSSPLQMVVDPFDNWEVTYGGGPPIMSSTNATYWPACLQDNAGCSTVAGPGGKLAVAFNNAFRWCPGGSSRPLGQCDTVQAVDGFTQPTAVQAEFNTLRWRVMQAMWLLGVANGDVPAGMFNVPVPVATNCQTADLPWAACYQGTMGAKPGGATLCEPGTSTNCLNEWTLTNASASTDINIIGTTYDIPIAFSAFMQTASTDVPGWYRGIYDGTPDATHAFVYNRDAVLGTTPMFWGTSQYCGVLGNSFSPTYCQFVSQASGAPPQGIPFSLATILGSTHNMDGLTCAHPWGEPSGGTPVAATKGPWDHPFTLLSALQPSPPWATFSFFAATQSPIPSPATITQYNVNSGLSAANGPNVLNWGLNTSGAPSISATTLPPSARAVDFIGAADSAFGEYTASNNGTCSALSIMLQAATLVCAAGPATTAEINAAAYSPTNIPQISTPENIVLLEYWLAGAEQSVSTTVGSLYISSIPTRVVTDFQKHLVGSGDLAGAKGQAILDLEQNMQAIPTSWLQIASDLTAVQSAVASARIGILGADLQAGSQEEVLAMQQMQVQSQLAQSSTGFLSAIAGAVGGIATGNVGGLTALPVAAMSMAQTQASGTAELDQLSQQQATAGGIETNNVSQVLATLNQTTSRLWTDMQTQIDTIRVDALKSLADAQQIQLIQGQASYQAAVGTGADFVNIAGQEIPIPVDTVLRRQASATEQRYQTALINAKALAYMARRAIEQRIGITLDAITTPVGPLDAPASWADDICSLQGVNYAALSSASLSPDEEGGVDGGGTGGSLDKAAISQFADSWVGDYVAKLQNFVTYYNAQYPSHQGSDTAVVSLRYDLLDPISQCSALGPNLLLNSGDLENTVDAVTSLPGWQKGACPAGSATCLAVLDGLLLQAPLDGPAGAVNGQTNTGGSSGLATGITWLSDIAEAPVDAGAPTDGGAHDAGAAEDGTTVQSAGPSNIVSQLVQLQAGTYVLSWWDQARDLCGNLFGSGAACSSVSPSTPASYVANIYDGNWNQVASHYAPPFVPSTGTIASAQDSGNSLSLWSSRNTLSFSVSTAGAYYVAFGASTLGNGPGSVAIASVQLELAPTSGQPSAYVGTGGSLMVTSFNCPPSDSDLRAAFQHNCDQNGVCSYDLVSPLIIDTQSLNAGQVPIDDKLAPGNYNYRHDTIAANLVGTGVHDCTNDPTASCYGTGYVQYDLGHDATSAGILDYSGNDRVFNFGVATINHGKALAAERYLTMPLASADQALISQPGILHEELSGRPLDGTYSLRIWDSPDLNWGQLQDIQLVLNYEYWSAIQVSGNTGDVKRKALRLGHPRAIPIPRH